MRQTSIEVLPRLSGVGRPVILGGRRPRGRPMRESQPPDYLLFAVISVAALIPLSFVDLSGGSGEFSLAGDVRAILGGHIPRIGSALVTLAMIALPAAGLGWWLQGVAARRGLRLTRRPRTEQAADYDDAPPGTSPPPTGPDHPAPNREH